MVPEIHLAATVQLVPSQVEAPQVFVVELLTPWSVPATLDVQVGKLEKTVGVVCNPPAAITLQLLRMPP